VTLPDLLLQIAYGKLAWGVVLAALVAALLPASRQLSRRATALLLGSMVVLTLLPGQFSPAYWIALALQWPSGLLVGLCLARLAHPWWPGSARSVLPPTLASAIALLGTILYFWGFGPRGAPLFALAAMALCVAWIIQGRSRPQAFATLGALTLFTLLRLPTGNLWDALLDPMLWIWAVLSLAIEAWRKRERNLATNNINEGVVSGKS
jgi:signal transduction histidine kinase